MTHSPALHINEERNGSEVSGRAVCPCLWCRAAAAVGLRGTSCSAHDQTPHYCFMQDLICRVRDEVSIHADG